MAQANMTLESFPWSLKSDVCDPYTFDLEHYARLWNHNSERLFVADSELRIKIIEVGEREVLFSNCSELEGYIASSTFMGTRVILVPQRFSWDRLMISEQGLRRLFCVFNIFPPFLDVVHAFGQKTSSESDTAGGCNSNIRGSLSEHCYLVNHAEEHGRDDSDNPWSIRQMGVYHQRDTKLDASTFIILNPSKNFQRRLREAQTYTDRPPAWHEIHLLALSCSTVPWRRYLTYVESQLARLKTKAHLSTVSERGGSKLEPKLKIEFGDTQDIQVVHDKLHIVNHILDSNQLVTKSITRLLHDAQSSIGKEVSPSPGPSSSGMAFCNAELEMQSRRIQTLFHRINAASGLMQDIIAFQGLEALNESGATSTEMARLAQIDNKLMLDFSAKSRQDASTLKSITILTMVYLPASFASQFLSMDYIAVHYAHHKVTLRFASEMWIFAILTVLLLGITIGCWLWLDVRRRPRPRLDCESGEDEKQYR